MLVISRKPGQAVQFPELGITITVTATGRSVRLGVEAPRKFGIVRGELAMRPMPAVEPDSPSRVRGDAVVALS
ncbi:carbon storage regulator [Alienimonas chondri]|uniref:carbon storage regulator n=1 Tax=Alienimonas chondri TaxID=2681879 RepID=UPI0014896F65|nr:carbon storage regulator [Alienimonas chondri]